MLCRCSPVCKFRLVHLSMAIGFTTICQAVNKAAIMSPLCCEAGGVNEKAPFSWRVLISIRCRWALARDCPSLLMQASKQTSIRPLSCWFACLLVHFHNQVLQPPKGPCPRPLRCATPPKTCQLPLSSRSMDLPHALCTLREVLPKALGLGSPSDRVPKFNSEEKHRKGMKPLKL